jgi:hypothetical protein
MLATTPALLPGDVEIFSAIQVPLEILERAQVRRVSHQEAQEVCGIRYRSQHLEGLAFPYLNPRNGLVLTWRVRRDHPEWEQGNPKAKYLSPPDRKHLYFPPDSLRWLNDISTPVIFVEAEKSALAILASCERSSRPALPVALGGCWGWKGTIGKTTDTAGVRVDEKGALPDLQWVTWTDRDVIILFDANVATNSNVRWARRDFAAELKRRGARVRLADVPAEPGVNGPDDYVGRFGDDALWKLLDGAIEHKQSTRGDSQATTIVRLVREAGVELWHSPDGDPYLTVRVDDHAEHHRLASRAARDWIALLYHRAVGGVPGSQAIEDAISTLRGDACFDGAEHPVSLRVAHLEDALYIDLGTDDWQAIEIDADGWRIVSNPPVRFWRPRSIRPLPMPVPGGSIDALRELWPVDDHTWTLLESWLVATVAPTGPYPVLILTGEQGTGKSTLGRMLRGVIDPASPELRGVPRDERDVMIGARTSHVFALDNLSGLPVWLSDALCRIATGGGFATRTLHTDLDETLIDVTRPILLTGIESPGTRGDLVDRALTVTLPIIDDGTRRDEAMLWSRFRELHPILLGALCTAASCALQRRATVYLERRPRMADACRWVTAAEPALGWAHGRTVAAWLDARSKASADLIANDAVAQAILELPFADTWTRTSGELLSELINAVPESVRNARQWPHTARGLSATLRRLAPDLRRMGLDVTLPEGLTGHERKRVITLKRLAPASAAHAPVAV